MATWHFIANFTANFTCLPKYAHFKNKLLGIWLLRGPSWSDAYVSQGPEVVSLFGLLIVKLSLLIEATVYPWEYYL